MDPVPQKTLILMRGLPGSGKSTRAKELAGQNGIIYSTDDFFMKDGKYIYEPAKIGDYHRNNFTRTEKAMFQGHPLIIVDNTNIKLWEMKKYVEAADANGYLVRVEQAKTDWAWDWKKCGAKNGHGVPADKVKMMLQNFEEMKSVDEIRARR